MLLGIILGVGIGGVVLWGFVLIICAVLGIPLETRRGREKRAAIAEQMRAASIEADAQRSLEVKAAEQRMSGI